MTEIDQIADDWARTLAQRSAATAIKLGLPTSDFADYSVDGAAELLREASTTRSRLESATPRNLSDRITRKELEREIDQLTAEHEAGLTSGQLNIIASPPQEIRDSFDLLPKDTDEQWATVGQLLRSVAPTLAGYQGSVLARLGCETGATRRQALAVAAQSEATSASFDRLAHDPRLPTALRSELAEAAQSASGAYAELARFLTVEVAPRARDTDAVGAEVYRISLRRFLGTDLNLDDTYEWGLQLLADLAAKQQSLAMQVCARPSVAEAITVLQRDPHRQLHGVDALRGWLQDMSDASLDALGGSHFKIEGALRRLQCKIAPAQDGGIYYTEPSLDGARAGTMWWSVPPGVDTFSTWRQKTTVYHEGVPGHHLQMGGAALNHDLNLWRRVLAGTSGHREGWALYAETLMHELGFLDDPADQFGMIDGQRMRAARVVIDIGLHTQRMRPDGAGSWTAEYALEFLRANTSMNEASLRYEILRYLGWPGQAASYSVGQRIWSDTRATSVAAGGTDLRTFHETALALGGLGLDTFQWAMSQITNGREP